MTENPTQVTSPILIFRKAQKLSRLALAQALGVSSSTILRWETGKSRPSPTVLEGLSTVTLPSPPYTTNGARSYSRLKHAGTSNHARRAAALTLAEGAARPLPLAGNLVNATATSWVRNGPPDQTNFHDSLIQLQLEGSPTIPASTLAKRFSLLERIENYGETAQFELEKPSPVATAWNSNYGSHGWHRYVGRFPPHVIRAILNGFGADRNSVVCDPFLGSGTTAVECRLLGIPFIGVEVCPLSCLISRTKAHFPDDGALLVQLSQQFEDFFKTHHEGYLGTFTHSDVLARPGNPVLSFPNIQRWFTPEALLGVSIAVEFAHKQTGYRRDAVFSAISSKMRSIGNVDVDVVRAEYSKHARASVNVKGLISAQLQKMGRDIDRMCRSHGSLMSADCQVEVKEQSVLDLHLPAGSVGHIITSPPYGVEAISYLRTHLLSYRSLLSELKHDPYETRDKTIGSEYTPRDQTVSFENAAQSSAAFRRYFSSLPSVPKLVHRTSAMKQFFEDLYSVGAKFRDWLRPGGNVAFILGNKRLGESIIPADQIVIEMFASLGLTHRGSMKHKLKTNNSNSSVPWQDRIIDEEAILLFRSNG